MSRPPDSFPVTTEMSCIWDDLGRAMEQLERHGVGEYFDPHRKAERFRAAVQDVTTGLSRLQGLIQRLGDLALHTPGMIEDMRVDRAALNELLKTAGVLTEQKAAFWLGSEPDSDGYWWHRPFPGGRAQIVNVWRVEMANGTKCQQVQHEYGTSDMRTMRERWPLQEWAGPITDPREPGHLSPPVPAPGHFDPAGKGG